MWRPGQEFDKKLNMTVPVYKPIPGFFTATPASLLPVDHWDSPRKMLFRGRLLPTFDDPVGYLARRYRLDGTALEHGVCKSGTNHRSSGGRGMPLRGKGRNCSPSAFAELVYDLH